MTYTTEVIIHLPRLKVIELFDSTENLYKWQLGLKSFESVSGEPGQEGALSRMIYEARKGEMEITETISRPAPNRPDQGLTMPNRILEFGWKLHFTRTMTKHGLWNSYVSYFFEKRDSTHNNRKAKLSQL